MKRTSGSAARPATHSGNNGLQRTSVSNRAIEQYSDDFVLRSGESIPLQVRDVLRDAKSEWVMMQRLPYEFVGSDQSSELMKCIQRIISMELKNQFTGQTVRDSDKQYVYDRKPDGEPLLKFKRCIGHFSLDKSEIHFLPFKISQQDIKDTITNFERQKIKIS